MKDRQKYWEVLGDKYGRGWSNQAQLAMSTRELAFIVRNAEEIEAHRVLDCGVGHGRILAALAACPPVSELAGIDIADAMIASCERRFATDKRFIGFSHCDISTENVPFKSGFDLITAIRVLKYSDNWPASLVRLLSVLRPEGRLVFSMPNRRSVNRLWKGHIHSTKTTHEILDAVVSAVGCRTVEIAGFSRLPDLLYRFASEAPLAAALEASEAAFEAALGPTLFTRELFVSIEKRSV